MPRLDTPSDVDPLIHFWVNTGSRLTIPAAGLSEAVYAQGSLPIRVREAARVTIATINQCQICLGLRSTDDGDEAPTADFYERLLAQDITDLPDRERLAADFARRFATDHLSMDDAFWTELKAAFTDTELVDLGVSVGSWLALGRLNQVFGVDGVCSVPVPGLQPVGRS